MEKIWKLLSKKEAFDSPHKRLEDWTFEVEEGKEQTYTLQAWGGGVVVFALTKDKKVLVLDQFFVSQQKKHITLVAGMIDKDKTPEEIAVQELREEAGCVAGSLISLGKSVRSKWITGYLHFFLALGVEQNYEQALNLSEDISCRFVDIETCKTYLRDGRLKGLFAELCARRAFDYLEKEEII
jgi:8-oxo-dGTP pyrophosphatase MutT (NUDIX family)